MVDATHKKVYSNGRMKAGVLLNLYLTSPFQSVVIVLVFSLC